MIEVIKNEVFKLLNVRIIYPISNSNRISLTQIVLKKSGIIIVKNEKGEPILT